MDNRAEIFPSNARNFFRLSSKEDGKRKMFFQKLISPQNIRLYTNNAVLRNQCKGFFEVKFPAFTARISERFEIWKVIRKHIRMVLWRRKLQFWHQFRVNFAGSQKNFGPYSGKDKKITLLTGGRFSTKWSSVNIECGSDKRTGRFQKIRKFWGSIPKKFNGKFVLFESFFPSKWSSLQVEVSSDNCAGFFFRQKSVVLNLKSKRH